MRGYGVGDVNERIQVISSVFFTTETHDTPHRVREREKEHDRI